MVQIHGDIFKTRCSRCNWRAELCNAHTRDDRDKSGLAGARPSIIEFSEQDGGRKMASRDVRNAMRSCGLAWFGSESLCLCMKPNALRVICNAILAVLSSWREQRQGLDTSLIGRCVRAVAAGRLAK